MTLWAAAIVLVALMIRGAWRGYRRGPWRQLAGPLALTLGLGGGWVFGAELGHASLQGTSYPWLLRGLTGVILLACLGGLISYALLWRIGRTPKGMVEAENPVWGAFIGCWTGALYFGLMVGLWATIASITELFTPPETLKPHWVVEIRDELAGLPVTAGLKDWSPIPADQRTMIRQTRRLMANPEARRRLMAQPEIRALAAHPSVYLAWEDKNVRKMLDDNDLGGFIEHPKVRAILADEALQREAAKIDLAALVERSLEKPRK